MPTEKDKLSIIELFASNKITLKEAMKKLKASHASIYRWRSILVSGKSLEDGRHKGNHTGHFKKK